jgi:hypothetical protein
MALSTIILDLQAGILSGEQPKVSELVLASSKIMFFLSKNPLTRPNYPKPSRLINATRLSRCLSKGVQSTPYV